MTAFKIIFKENNKTQAYFSFWRICRSQMKI